uniref:Uncharacterized protein n=1 Tax=Anopheles atroparvus TaxID=41427 RepID=A0A182JB88_ANOAO
MERKSDDTHRNGTIADHHLPGAGSPRGPVDAGRHHVLALERAVVGVDAGVDVFARRSLRDLDHAAARGPRAGGGRRRRRVVGLVDLGAVGGRRRLPEHDARRRTARLLDALVVVDGVVVAPVRHQLDVVFGLQQDAAALLDHHQLVRASAQCIVDRTAQLAPAPLGLQEVPREDHHDAAGSSRRFEKLQMRGVLRQVPLGRDVARHKLRVLGRVHQDGVVQLLGVFAAWPKHAHAVAREQPEAERLAKDEHDQQEDEQAGEDERPGQQEDVRLREPIGQDGAAGVEVAARRAHVKVQLAVHTVVHAVHVLHVLHDDRVVRHERGQLLEEPAPAAPLVAPERERLQTLQLCRLQLKQGHRRQPVPVDPEHPQRVQRRKRPIGDRLDGVVLQVQLPQQAQVLELVPVDALQGVVLQMQHLERRQPRKRSVLDGGDAARVRVQHLQVLAPDERVVLQLREVIAVQVHLGGVHRHGPRTAGPLRLLPTAAVHHQVQFDGHVISQSHASKSQQWQRAKQCVSYRHRKSFGLSDTIGRMGEPRACGMMHSTFGRSMIFGCWRVVRLLTRCIHSIEQSHSNGLPPR